MLRTWDDSWFEEGLRVFYVVPRTVTDAVLPLAIEPPPTELDRVLVGRMEILTPEMERAAEERLLQLDASATPDPRLFGRFTEPILRRMRARTDDPETAARIDALLAR